MSTNVRTKQNKHKKNCRRKEEQEEQESIIYHLLIKLDVYCEDRASSQLTTRSPNTQLPPLLNAKPVHGTNRTLISQKASSVGREGAQHDRGEAAVQGQRALGLDQVHKHAANAMLVLVFDVDLGVCVGVCVWVCVCVCVCVC